MTKIQGQLEIHGVILHLDIEAADGVAALYVTNISPQCLVVPRERWKVEWMGLPPDVLEEVKSKGVKTIGDLVGKDGNVTIEGASDRTRKLAEFAWRAIKGQALTFEIPEGIEATATPWVPSHTATPSLNGSQVRPDSPDEGRPSQAVPATEGPDLQQALRVLGLPSGVTEAIEARCGVRTIGDMRRVTRSDLYMVPKMQMKYIKQLEERLTPYGVVLEGGSSAALPGGAPR